MEYDNDKKIERGGLIYGINRYLLKNNYYLKKVTNVKKTCCITFKNMLKFNKEQSNH